MNHHSALYVRASRYVLQLAGQHVHVPAIQRIRSMDEMWPMQVHGGSHQCTKWRVVPLLDKCSGCLVFSGIHIAVHTR